MSLLHWPWDRCPEAPEYDALAPKTLMRGLVHLCSEETLLKTDIDPLVDLESWNCAAWVELSEAFDCSHRSRCRLLEHRTLRARHGHRRLAIGHRRRFRDFLGLGRRKLLSGWRRACRLRGRGSNASM
jgi:hypothetical protein